LIAKAVLDVMGWSPALNTNDYADAQLRQFLTGVSNPVIVEIGVFDGTDTRKLLSWCTSKPLYYGFEADSRNVKNVRNYGVDRLINFFPVAVGNVTGKAPFYWSSNQENGVAGSSSLSEFTPNITKHWPWLHCLSTETVDCWKLDDFCKQYGISHIDLLWMDVQGAERLVVEGAKVMLGQTRMVWTEYDDGTLYKDSSSRDSLLSLFPSWDVVADVGDNVLLKNPGLWINGKKCELS
jgi:FkbM family methyltransferase